MKIVSVKAIEILDSRGNPTIKSFVILDDGSIGTASIPSGASTGSHEAIELRDKDQHYLGKGVQHAVHNVNNEISHKLIGFTIDDLEKIDTWLIDLDGTENKSHLGANAILSVSLACARALAAYRKEPLWRTLNEVYFPHTQTRFPRLMVNVINGGEHANWNLDIQEFMISPFDRTPSSSIETSANVFHSLKELLDAEGYSTAVGDEGGFAPDFDSNRQALEMLQKAIHNGGYSRDTVDIALDVAASEFYDAGEYHLRKENRRYSAEELIKMYEMFISEFNISSFEDPFHEDDWHAFSQFTKIVGKKHLVVGDDLFVTNLKRIEAGIDRDAANAVLIKVNQIGSLYETVQAIRKARSAGWKIVISHRSGETEDHFISDLAFSCASDFIKAGSMSRSERLAKYNRLLEIEKIEI